MAEVPLSFVRALVVQARHSGHDVAAILAAARFPFDPLKVAEAPATVTRADYNRLCLALFAAMDDESGGIIQGVPTVVGTTRMLLLSLLHCRTLADALQRAIEFNATLREPGAKPRLHRLMERDDVAQLEYLPRSGGGSQQAAVLCSMAIWLRVAGWLVGRDIDLLHAGLAGPMPLQRAGLQHFFHCPIAAEQDCNWIAFPSRYLQLPLCRNEADLNVFLREAAYRTVIQPPCAEGPVGQQLRTLLESRAFSEWPDFNSLAGELSLSIRTVRRHLAAEGDSFQRLRDRIRRDRALADLRAGYSVEQVAERSGFNDSSAFHRAFRRWTGVSPGQFR